MRTVALVCAAITCGILAGSGFSLGSIPLGGAAVALAVVWVIILWSDARARLLSVLLVMATVLAAINVLYGTSAYAGGAVVVLALVSWELALAIESLAALPKEKVRALVYRHITQMLLVAMAGYALFAIPLQLSLHLDFRAALGLGLFIFLLFALLLRHLVDRRARIRNGRLVAIARGWNALKEALQKKDGRP